MKSLDELIAGTPLDKFLDESARGKVRIGTYHEGARIRLSESILFLVEGHVSFSFGDEDGNPYHMIVVRAFNSIGELIYYHKRKIFDIFALDDVSVIELPLKLVRELEKEEEFKVFLLTLGNKNLMGLVDKMLKRNLYKLENYLAYIIVTDQLEGRYYYKSMTSLASVFNVSRRNLYYAADSLEAAGYMEKKKGYFEIKNMDALKEMI